MQKIKQQTNYAKNNNPGPLNRSLPVYFCKECIRALCFNHGLIRYLNECDPSGPIPQ